MMNDFKTFYENFKSGNLSPLNKRRKILLEAQYIFPSSGDKAIMDLYALYSLWWDFGGGKESGGYEQGNIRNYKVKERVDRFFEEALVVIADNLLKESKVAIEDEIENIFDSYLINPEDVMEWFKENGLLRELKTAYNDGEGGKWFKVFSYGKTMDIFGAPFWEKNAEFYGGDKWVEITQAVRDLDNALRRENVQNLMFAVDKLMDLEHNTGSLSSKLNKVKVNKKTLDLRSQFKSPKDFMPYVSPQVQKLLGLYRGE